jgi:hypothetical protein
MASPAHHRIGAESSRECPTPAPTFGDLPRAHQREILRFAAAAALTTAFFLTLGLLTRWLPSRSLAARAVLPDAEASHVALLDPLPIPPHARPSPRSPLERAARSRAKSQLASLREPPGDDTQTAPATTEPGRRRNIFRRLFLGVFRGASTANPRPDVP